MKSYSPKEVAQAMGVSQASIKRWVDKGLIVAEKTAGGHRRITQQALFSYLQASNKDLTNPEVLKLPATSGRLKTRLNESEALLIDELKECREGAAQALVNELFQAGVSCVELVDKVMKPAVEHIKECLKQGALESFQERRCNQIVQRLIFSLNNSLSAPPVDAAHVILGTLSKDMNTLDIQMLELCLRQQGLRTEFLGADLNPVSYRRALEMLQPQFIALGFSVLSESSLGELHQIDDYCGQEGIRLLLVSDLPIDISKGFKSTEKISSFSELSSLL